MNSLIDQRPTVDTMVKTGLPNYVRVFESVWPISLFLRSRTRHALLCHFRGTPLTPRAFLNDYCCETRSFVGLHKTRRGAKLVDLFGETSETRSCCRRQRSPHTRQRGVARSDADLRTPRLDYEPRRAALGRLNRSRVLPRISHVGSTIRTTRIPLAIRLYTISLGLWRWCRRHSKHCTQANVIPPVHHLFGSTMMVTTARARRHVDHRRIAQLSRPPVLLQSKIGCAACSFAVRHICFQVRQ